MKCVTSIGKNEKDDNSKKTSERAPESTACKVMSMPEKEILCTLLEEEAPLDYPLRALRMASGPDAQEYVIPEEDKADVLQELYPFVNCPKLDDKLFDLHEGRFFTVRDYKVIREMGRNFLVSPYYASSGGMVVDWIEQELSAGASEVRMVKSVLAPQA